MKRWIAWPAAVGMICLAAGLLEAAPDDGADHQRASGMLQRPPGRIMGRVKEVSLQARKLAIEVETEENPDGELRIFLLSEETKVRKEEHVKGLDDLKKGMRVLVFFRASQETGGTPTAFFIRILDGRRWSPRPRR